MKNKSNAKEDINTIELIEARSKEIQFIEESIKKSNKKTMLFQRLPFYKRRRNRNYDRRKSKKFSYRKKDRHFLRSHTFYAKRFFMLKLYSEKNKTILKTDMDNQSVSSKCQEQFKLCDVDTDKYFENNHKYNDISIPIKRRIKSSKYIYKSQDCGFLFDESFRGGFSYPTDLIINLISKYQLNENQISKEIYFNEMIPTLNKITLMDLSKSVNINLFNQVQTIDNAYEVIITKTEFYIIGAWIQDCDISATPLNGILSIFRKENYGFYELKNIKNMRIFPTSNNSIQSYKIICERSEIMQIFESLINNSIIPICLEEIYRISLENDTMTVYDNIKNNLFKIIEDSINREIIDKYNRTPKSKNVLKSTGDLYITNDKNLEYINCKSYFIFKVEKGNAERGAQIFKNDICIGRVIRSSYKFTSGKCYGLGIAYSQYSESLNKLFLYDIEKDDKYNFTIRNLGKFNFYKISIIKILD